MHPTIRFYLCAVSAVLRWTVAEAAARVRRALPRRRRRQFARRVAAVIVIALLVALATHAAPIVHAFARHGGMFSSAPAQEPAAAPVPEPASILLFGEALFVLIHVMRARRRRRQSADGRTA